MRFILMGIGVTVASGAALAQQQVDGYVRKDGVYVPPHYRSQPDNTRTNNWTSQGNTNPYTGQAGSRDPYAPQQPSRPSGGVNNFNNSGRNRY